MDVDDLASRQLELGKEIQQFIDNCKKAPVDRRTSYFYDAKIKGLQDLGDELHRNHGELERLREANPDKEYFKSNDYEKYRNLVVEYIKTLEKRAKELAGYPAGIAAAGLSSNDDAEGRKRLRNQRALIQAIQQNVNNVMDQRANDHPQSYYTITATILENHMITLATNNNAIWDATDKDNIEGYTLQTYYEIEQQVKNAMIELQQHMTRDEHNTSNHSGSRSTEPTLKLPTITLPKFNGEYLQWEGFKDLYTEIVHNAPISDSQRMHYLTQALTDEPKSLIQHLPSTGNNYSAAWTILTNRYDNKRLLVSALLNKLFSQQTIKTESPATIKSLHDTTKECIYGLKSQGLPVQHWDAIIAHFIIRKMDLATQTIFEQGINDNKRLLTQEEVLKFLERRFQSLEVRGVTDRSSKRSNKGESNTRTCASAVKTTSTNDTCLVCKGSSHKLYACKAFTDADLSQKWKWVKDLKLCINCLRPGHQAEACKSRNCTKCTRKHNTLMHNDKGNQYSKNNGKITSQSPPKSSTTKEEISPDQSTNKVSLLANSDEKYILLGTARIRIATASGEWIDCRAILDSGSQAHMITEHLVKKLGTETRLMPMNIECVANSRAKLQHCTTITLKSRTNDFIAHLEAHITPKIVSRQPMQLLDIQTWDMPQDISLADPEFYKPGPIDLLIGGEIFYELLTEGKIKLSDDLPIIKSTVFGWIVGGKINDKDSSNIFCGMCTTQELEETVSKFWESEEIPDHKSDFSEDELRCESHFLQHTKQDSDGKFVVRLPLKEHPSALSNSKGIAYQRLQTLERRFANNKALQLQYSEFMKEYELLGHMTQVTERDISSSHYYIPHHCVLRPESTSTKLRVVFDASARKSSGSSLNDIMYNGPTVQSELFSILLRFRMRRYVMKTDIEKMYRQIWVDKADRNLQLILWRDTPTQPPRIYQLNTVTYGTRAAPYLATRCLNQLADDNQSRFPYGSSALKHNFYVDDGLVGADSLFEAVEIQSQLITILSSAGMKLKKWCANNPKLLRGIASEDQEVNLNFESEETQSTKTLGLLWQPKSDMLCVKANVITSEKTTKRTISSDLARIYDPLGLIGPVLVTGKIQLQNLWKLKLDWDAEVPFDIKTKWSKYKQELSILNNVAFPRHVVTGHESIQLHAFADASEKAFGAAIYVRTVQKDKTVRLNLLCSRSRVAPIKNEIKPEDSSIPRLELCAALLAAELMARVRVDMGYQSKASYFWSDSTTVLSWIHQHPGRQPAFVANRLVKIRSLTIPEQWRHVPSKQNPADILSRGIKPRDFASCHMWLYGPMFLFQHQSSWSAPFKREGKNEEEEMEEDTQAVLAVTDQPTPEWIYTIPSRNSFTFVQRVVAYILRFVNNTRKSRRSRPQHVQLSPLELESALIVIIQQIQSIDFQDIKKTLRKEQYLPKTHKLSSLTPFLDERGIIRVGGRLDAATQPFDAKHQMIVPGNDPIIRLLVEKLHKDHYHCGPQALLAQIRQRFWPLKAKGLTRAIIQRCVTCTKARPKLLNQIMGNLPATRVEPARPFIHSGVDYCGPLWVHYKTRGKRPQKAYLAVFCCFSTKAVHFELVTELTTDSFIGALKRFIGRRGHCKALYCDNATNFVGAKNQLQEINNIIQSNTAKAAIIRTCSSKGIDFQFIPPRSPHFGGLWEAAVKSAKHLLLKNISAVSLTYEELETAIVEIEAILNSRPLVPLSSNPNDFNALTPGHFLIGEELTSTVDVHTQAPKGRMVDRWQQVSQLKHNFWQRWSKEYLHELQQRHKWKGPVKDIHENTMVIIKEDNLPVLQWPLGRITKVYPGDDGIIRVCDVKTQKGIFKRPVHRLAPLFPEDDAVNLSTQPCSIQDEQETNIRNDEPCQVSLPISIPLDRLSKGTRFGLEATPRKRQRLSPGLVFTILTLCLLPLALCSPINLTNFNNKPGIYFEKLGNVKLVTTNWNMVVYYDLGPLQDETSLLFDGTSTLQKLCDNASTDSPCQHLLQFFDHALDELQSKTSLLSTKRAKRGAMDVVGNIANSLFGVLDSNYETKMSATIESLRKNDAHLELLLKNQTSLVDSTVNIIKANQLNAQAKFDEIDARIHDLVYGNEENTPMHEIRVQQTILTLAIQLFMMVSNLQWTYSSIMDVLIDSHHDKINPLLLKPHQLSSEITKIKAHLPTHQHLPIHEGNLLEAYNLMTIKGVVAKTHVIFYITLPLSDQREFELLHLVPIATTANNSLAVVKLSTMFLAISPHRDEFIPLSQHQVDECRSSSTDEFLCQNLQATFHTASSTCKCELDLFTNQAHPACEFYTLEEKMTWNQLKHLNHWIYATTKTVRLNAVCQDEYPQLELNGSGLLQLRPDCILKNELLTIKGHTPIVTKIHTTSSKVLAPLGWNKQYTSNNISTKSFKPNIHDLESIQEKLAHINASSLPNDFSTANKHSLLVSYFTIALVVIVTGTVIYKIKIIRRNQPIQPIPQPRIRSVTANTAC